MADCGRVNHGMLQWLTNCLTPSIIDRAVGDMKLDSQSGPQLATYVRYNVELETNWLSSKLGIELAADKIAQIATDGRSDQYGRPCEARTKRRPPQNR